MSAQRSLERTGEGRGWIRWALVLLLLADLVYSFQQHRHQTLDGDMAWNVVPAEEVRPILEDPLAIGVIIEGRTYPNPNRFFCHWAFRGYLLAVPLWLQHWVPPIDSVYLACAIAKTGAQLVLILLLAAYASGTRDPRDLRFLLAALLVTPLFQTNGFRTYMGGIDPSTTYTFFYAWPCALLLAYFLPLYLQLLHRPGRTVPGWYWCWTIPAAFVVCLSGPLNPGAVLVAGAVMIGRSAWRAYRQGAGAREFFPAVYRPFLVPAMALALYSLYIGQSNSITIGTRIPLEDMYARLPAGVYYLLTQKLGFPVLLVLLLVNGGWSLRHVDAEGRERWWRAARWVAAFSLLYVLLLPLGGYREYRPNILRYDTIVPITLAVMYLFALSTLEVLRTIRRPGTWYYGALIAGGLIFFTVADEPELDNDRCERDALEVIAAAEADVVALHRSCSVLDWGPITSPEASRLNAELLLHWRIIDRPKLYFNAATR